MKKTIITTLTALSFILCGYADTTSIHWQTLGNRMEGENAINTQRLTLNTGDGIQRILFNCFARDWWPANPLDTVKELIPGYYYIASPRLLEPGQEVSIDLESYFPVRRFMDVPDGFHMLKTDGTVVPVDLIKSPLADNIDLLKVNGKRLRYLRPDSIYRLNEKISQGATPGAYDIAPSFKRVTMSKKKGIFRQGDPIERKIIKHKNPEYYKITVSDGKAKIEAASRGAADMAERMLTRRLLPDNDGTLPAAVIEDWPDFPYRGFMLDIVRNNISLPDIYRTVDLMADLRMNRLHFHFSDDEAWRLEIPGLPELTEFGSKRGYTTDEKEFLCQVYSGDGNPENPKNNGFITRKEMIEFLKYCKGLGIEVIPEIESPGHARAAVKAMERRYRLTGDDTYRLIEEGDTSRYTTAQDYHDNLMNPALEGPYRFMEKVIDELASMYADAGVPLTGIHIGGDEVPRGAWDGSPSMRKMMAEKGIKSKHEAQGEFARRMARIFRDKRIPMYGWQEIGTGYNDDINRELLPVVGGFNCWTANYDDEYYSDLGVKNGFPVILSNVDYFYLDQMYENHPDAKGLAWGGIVDEFRTLHGYASELCPAIKKGPGEVIGISAQVFGETLRSFDMVERFLMPRFFGVAERAWNAGPTYSDPDWNILIGERELPRAKKSGLKIHLRQPGIMIEEGKIMMNSPYPGAKIRYTLDGSAPTSTGTIYTEPIPYNEGMKPRAILEYLGEESLPTIL